MHHSLTTEVGLQIADAAIFSTTSRHLSTIEAVILEGVLQGKKYGEIAVDSGYSPEYLKNNVGPKLWKLLSESFGEKVNKKNLVAVLARQNQASGMSLQLAEYPNYTDNSTNPHTRDSFTKPIPEVAIESPQKLTSPNSALYVKRPPIEGICCRKLEEPGALIRIKAPKQMGKTSLMLFCLAHARQQGYRTATLSLQRADRATFTDLDKFLRWFCTAVSHQLGLSNQSVEETWNTLYGSKSNCTNYFEDCLLSQTDVPLTLALDQVDEVFLYPGIGDEFFSLLRSWYEEASYDNSKSKLWQKLRILIVHSTEVYVPLDINRSPFNVGLTIALPPFTKDQVRDLVQRHKLDLSETQVDNLMELLSGHPYMMRLALFHLSQRGEDWQAIFKTAATDAGIYADLLRRHLRYLQENPELAQAYQQVIKTDELVELEQVAAFKLNSMGLVNLHGNAVVNSCELYRRYFSDQLKSSLSTS